MVFFHGLHLVVKALLKVLDNWSWGDDLGDLAPPTRYCNGVSNCSSVWRNAGNHDVIFNALAAEFCDATAMLLARRIPGQCIRGRWLAIDAVEDILLLGQPSSIGLYL